MCAFQQLPHQHGTLVRQFLDSWDRTLHDTPNFDFLKKTVGPFVQNRKCTCTFAQMVCLRSCGNGLFAQICNVCLQTDQLYAFAQMDHSNDRFVQLRDTVHIFLEREAWQKDRFWARIRVVKLVKNLKHQKKIFLEKKRAEKRSRRTRFNTRNVGPSKYATQKKRKKKREHK